MPAIDYSHMTAAEKLDLIAELCNSIEADAVPLTPAQAAEIERRLATLDADSKHSRPAAAVSADLRKYLIEVNQGCNNFTHASA